MVVKLKAPSLHAIRIVKYIGEHQGETMVAGTICREIDLTQSYFMRLVKDLRKAGILDSVQGRHGGFVLNRPAEDITLYEIVEAMEGDEDLKQEESESLGELMEKVNSCVNNILSEVNLAQL